MPTMRPHPVPLLRRAAPAALAAALVLGLAACEPDLAPPFEPEGTGTISGRLFFDADEDGLFSPTRGDTLLAGVPIEVRQRGSEEVLGDTETEVDGSFTIDGIPVGTHDVYVVATTETVGDVVVCENPLEATVYRDEETFVTPVGKVACIIDIAEAKELAVDELAIVVGIVTAEPGVYRANNMYIQDETGGIQVFGVTTAGLVRGDVVEVRGDRGAFSGEIQIDGTVTVEKLGTTSEVAPEVLALGVAGGITDPEDPRVGALITVQSVSVGAFGVGGQAGNANMTRGDETGLLRLDTNAATTIGTAFFEAGKCYNITGPLGIFNGVTQLKPRDRSDVVEVPCP
jgi:DNA/RNA endonuclease YhcR with UshA esterase domain